MAQETIELEPTKTSGLFTLNWRDLVLGLVIAVGSAGLTALQQFFSDGAVIDWHLVAYVSVSAAVTYILKNFLSTDTGKVAGVVG